MKLNRIENGTLTYTEVTPSFTDECDILVVGAGAGGIFAASTAAEEGADVILIENDINIGGMRVRGNVTPYYYGAPGGSFEADDQRIASGGGFAYVGNQPEPRQIVFTERLKKSGTRLITDTLPTGIYFDGERAVGLRVFSKGKTLDIKARIIVDATSDGHLIRMSGAEYSFGRKRDGKVAPFTVRTQYIKNGRYISINDDSGYINQYDEAAFSDKVIRAHANAEKFLSDGDFLSLPTQAGVREGITFIGEDRVNYEDLVFGRFCKNPLFYAYADLDKHGHDRALDDEIYQTWMTVANLATVTVNIPVPMGAVLPKGVRGIVTAGRCLSIDTYALGAVRMNRDMYRMGECVGIACAMAIRSGCDFSEINYAEYREKAESRGCFNGYPDRTVGFDNNRNLISYKPLEFTVDKTIDLLSTETPGAAIWSAYLMRTDKSVSDRIANMMENAESTATVYNCAIALGAMEDKRALPVLRKIVKNRDCYYYKDCRRSNQHRSAMAVCLLGRVGDSEDIAELESIVFDENEINKELYHVLSPEYIHHIEKDRNFLFFDIYTHAVMAMVKIYKREGLDTIALKARLEKLFADEATIRRITHVKSDEPAYIEIKAFFRGVLGELDLKTEARS